ncbi:uncharacterized protein LOC117119126 [Anneissia japonica]|uniref:uncharacterized protein LOC117119126 n=1 Tax=Anneissia japonica TaxID=1529436 RepID=UPI0014254B01|nr:uncharacterized protein LOC117119126 [Anneissia japonica]
MAARLHLLLSLLVWQLSSFCVHSWTPAGVSFVGIGYNILDGNPDGGDPNAGGVDPGLLVTRRILEFSYEDGNLSEDGIYPIPDEVLFSPRDSCSEVETTEIFEGTKSYQEKLERDIDYSFSGDHILLGYQFSKSGRYERIYESTEYQKKVFHDYKKVCNKGQARYLTELAAIDGYELARDFVASACALPEVYDEAEYMNFLDLWGTDIVVEVDLGTKLSNRSEIYQTDFVFYAMKEKSNTVSPGGNFLTYKGSVVVDMNKFRQESGQETTFGSYQELISVGTPDLPEPISVKLMYISDVFHSKYWSQIDSYVSSGSCNADHSSQLAAKKQNVFTALTNYGKWRNALISDDPPVQIPITWPIGTYSLPMVESKGTGCPDSHFSWKAGSRFQDTENYLSDNHWSDPCHLRGPYKRNDITQNFCSKTVEYEDSYQWEWGEGTYCIFKKGTSCPAGFDEGWIYWNDENTFNSNWLSGELPTGIYDEDTQIYFCCREDGFATNPIYMPIDDVFFLFKKNHLCQEVAGMTYVEEYMEWDNENEIFDGRTMGGSYPYNTDKSENHILHYCYYYPKA